MAIELIQADFRKGNIGRIDDLDKEIVPLILEVNRLPFIYTTESCFGHFEKSAAGGVRYLEGFINFVLSDDVGGRDFLKQLKDINQAHLLASHLAQDYPFHSNSNNLGDNGFHFGILHPGSLMVANYGEGNRFRNQEDGDYFKIERNKIWDEWMALVKKY